MCYNILGDIMEKFYFEFPTLEREKDAKEYIEEFFNYNSRINGVGGLDHYYQDYPKWLNWLEECKHRVKSAYAVPSRTYFLIRESDNKIIGMSNIRLELNGALEYTGHHIGYGIRPTERRKGYNKINLYLGLKICQKYGIKEAFLDSEDRNVGSWKTMEAVGGKLVKTFFEDKYYNLDIRVYSFDVDKVLEDYKDIYGQYILDDFVKE